MYIYIYVYRYRYFNIDMDVDADGDISLIFQDIVCSYRYWYKPSFPTDVYIDVSVDDFTCRWCLGAGLHRPAAGERPALRDGEVHVPPMASGDARGHVRHGLLLVYMPQSLQSHFCAPCFLRAMCGESTQVRKTSS